MDAENVVGARAFVATIRRALDLDQSQYGNFKSAALEVNREMCDTDSRRKLTWLSRYVTYMDYIPEAHYLIMEYLPLGDLTRLQDLSGSNIRSTLVQCLTALDYLHGEDILHRDLKPANILIAALAPLRLKLADFGLASRHLQPKTFCGTSRYLAPEVGDGNYSNKVDIWSLGVVIFDMMRQPTKSDFCLHHKNMSRKICRDIAIHASDDLGELLRDHLLRWRPLKRANAAFCLHRAQIILDNYEKGGLSSMTLRQTETVETTFKAPAIMVTPSVLTARKHGKRDPLFELSRTWPDILTNTPAERPTKRHKPRNHGVQFLWREEVIR